MRMRRTDLALEARELWQERAGLVFAAFEKLSGDSKKIEKNS